MSKTIVLFRNDLRLNDNPAFYHACKRNNLILPVYIIPDNDKRPLRSASQVWLHHSLHSLQKTLHKHHLKLTIKKGDSLSILKQLVEDTKADSIYWNRRYDQHSIEEDKKNKSALIKQGIEAKSFNASLLIEPWEMQTKQETPYKVFTPFWKAFSSLPITHSPLPNDWKIEIPKKWPGSIEIDDLDLMPKIKWYNGILKSWSMGEDAAWERLNAFLDESLDRYEETRNDPSIWGTSRMSPYLHFGEISPRQIWAAVMNKIDSYHSGDKKQSAWAFLRELGWREFSHHLLYHFPDMVHRSMREEFTKFPWQDNDDQLEAWQNGMTGYPLVDAGMRELWTTGWMNNRVRMVVGSFLVKDLLIPWQKGEQWFWDTLLDADIASNTMNWQWVSGCGVDAAPYFRIFNPVTQSEKFDPEGKYIRQWIPEIKSLDNKWIHKPWEAPESLLQNGKIELGKDYPYPIVDHRLARQKALHAFESIKKYK